MLLSKILLIIIWIMCEYYKQHGFVIYKMGCTGSKNKNKIVKTELFNAENDSDKEDIETNRVIINDIPRNQHELKLLKQIKDYDKIEKFTLNGLQKYAIVKSCYDGDSAHIAIFMDDKYELREFMCRFMWYDSPEICRVADKTPGIIARDYLKELIEHKVVFVKFYKFDKYRRPLVEVFNIDDSGTPEEISVNQKMMNKFPDMPKMKYKGH